MSDNTYLRIAIAASVLGIGAGLALGNTEVPLVGHAHSSNSSEGQGGGIGLPVVNPSPTATPESTPSASPSPTNTPEATSIPTIVPTTQKPVKHTPKGPFKCTVESVEAQRTTPGSDEVTGVEFDVVTSNEQGAGRNYLFFAPDSESLSASELPAQLTSDKWEGNIIHNPSSQPYDALAVYWISQESLDISGITPRQVSRAVGTAAFMMPVEAIGRASLCDGHIQE